MGKARAVRNVNPLTLGSGVKARELIPLPYFIVFIAIFVRGCFKHYLITCGVLLSLFLWWNAYVAQMAVGLVLVFGTWAALIFTTWLFLGGDFKTPYRYFLLKTKWRHACISTGVKSREGNIIPPIRRIRPVRGGIRCDVLLAYAGRGMTDLHAESDDIAEIVGAYRSTVSMVKPGRGRLTLYWTRDEIFSVKSIRPPKDGKAAPLPIDNTKVVFGRASNGDAEISMLTSILIVGMSNSGKSNILRNVVHGLRRHRIPHKFHVIDPAGGVELNELEGYEHTIRYVDRAKNAEQLIRAVHADMDTRLADMRRDGVHKVFPNSTYPLNVLIIDELLLLGSQLKEGANSDLGEILTIGRKAGFIVIALSQLSQVDAIGRLRDLFPQRVCLATRSTSMTDAALGDGAEKAGARCSEISANTPGVGYYYSDDRSMGGFERFRAAEAQGTLVEPIEGEIVDELPPKPRKRKCAVYRFYDIAGNLLYVGKTIDPDTRFKQHASTKFWWGHVDHTRTSIHWYSSEEIAEDVETQAIWEEKPRHNKQSVKVVR